MTSIFSVFPADSTRAYIAPLFWQHGETPEVLREEVRQMHQAGIDGFVVESRPHPDFLGPGWWATLDLLLDEAKRRAMRVWVFDDKQFPTGYANGAVVGGPGSLRKQFVAHHCIDSIGPRTGASFHLHGWIKDDETLLAVVVARRLDSAARIDGATLMDVTDRVHDGVLYWDLPPGPWRVFVILRTPRGGEEWTKDYINPIDTDAVKVLIDTIYEPHFQHYGSLFGHTFAGFFNDEPRFGNAATYEARLGHYDMVLPWSGALPAELDREMGEPFARFWPALWFDAAETSSKARYIYMDTVSRLYRKCFSLQIGDWCRRHGVQSIGHVVEDNGAHARLGYGSGHFFRALAGQDIAGLDAVYQIWPDFQEGRFLSPFGDLDAAFFYWGIAKMASSAAHIDPRKHGTTVCELFGAYGWQCGLRLMKWLTDHMLVRGVNFLIPHAFSPKAFPDPDCPPHFYARGNNPQWRYFATWSGYAGRLCRLLTGGTHVAPVVLLYHAEAEWAGEYEPFERVVKTLAQRQVDCDVVPVDTLIDANAARFDDRRLCINGETYGAIIVPYSAYLPAALLTRLQSAAEAGIHVVFTTDWPTGAADDPRTGAAAVTALRTARRARVLNHEMLADALANLGVTQIATSSPVPDLRIYHYQRNGRSLFMLVNQSTHQAMATDVTFAGQSDLPAGYDALADAFLRIPAERVAAGVCVHLELRPFESLFLIFPGADLVDTAAQPAWWTLRQTRAHPVTGPWRISSATAMQFPHFTPAAIDQLGNVAQPGLLATFSGTLRYQTRFDGAAPDPGSRVILDLGEVFEVASVRLNAQDAGVRICPPYQFDITALLKPGANDLEIDITNTLAKSHGDNDFDRAMAQDPTGLLGPVMLAYRTAT